MGTVVVDTEAGDPCDAENPSSSFGETAKPVVGEQWRDILSWRAKRSGDIAEATT